MAHMSPGSLPEEVRADPARQAESAVYDALRDQLDDSWSVFYSVEWNARVAEKEPAQDGEADFVVCHPNHGFLVLEVKGGIVAFDPERGRWTSTSRSGFVNDIADPFAQARKSCYGLLARTRGMVSQQGTMRMFHATVFPHCLMRAEDLPGCAQPEIVIDAEGVREMRRRVERAFRYWKNGADLRGPSFDELASAIRRLHNRPVTGHRNKSLEIVEHHNEFDRLTDGQLRVLDMVAANRRLLVRGCAGSGKTFLAKRLAARRSSEGKAVLVLCFNNLLGSLLNEELGELPNVKATNFHGLCERLVLEAGMPLDRPAAGADSAYYTDLVEKAFGALGALPSRRFDAIIVDEAQDFQEDWWIVVEALLAGEGSCMTVFLDANQRLYGAQRGVPTGLGSMAEVDLSQNVRNTQAIHSAALRFFEGEPLPTALGPQGVAPRWIPADTVPGRLERLRSLLDHLILQDRVAADDLVVLTPKGIASTGLGGIDRLGEHILRPFELREAGEVGWSTVRKFKGLESPIVILTEFDDEAAGSPWLRELAYVGMTRARDFLYLIGSKKAVRELRGR